MIDCGIIGFGKMGKIRANAIESSGKGQVVAIYDIDPPSDCPYQTAKSPEEVIATPGMDAVFICTPNAYIPTLCIKALNSGKHVFAEKPPGLNAAQVEEVIVAEKASAGRKLMYGFNHRHHRSIQRMKKIVESGELGQILWMRGRYGKEVDRSFFEGWRADPKISGAGILLDQGIHMIDLMIHLGGEFDEVSSIVSNLFWKIDGIEDNVFAIFRNSKTGACASVHSTMTQWRYLFSLEVFLEGGALILNGLKTSSGAYGDEDLAIKRNPSHLQDGRYESEEHIIYHTDASWQSEINHFFDCINNDLKISHGSPMDAITVMRVVDEIYRVGNKLN